MSSNTPAEQAAQHAARSPHGSVRVRACANIALVKYWGKRDAHLNLPAAGSLSISLAGLHTTTTVKPDPGLTADVFELDGEQRADARIGAFLDLVRQQAGVERFFRVSSQNNFPTGAGLASSASGFAALALAATRAIGLELDHQSLSVLARRGSGSAARSIHGGFVEMDPGRRDDGQDAHARQLGSPDYWPLEVLVAITDESPKAIASGAGMNHTQATSIYYRSWIDGVQSDLAAARIAIEQRDFEQLAEVAEASALKMHASAIAARPGLLYWSPATVACVHRIRALRAQGEGVFFTIDAGPQVKVICLPGHSARAREALASLDGVVRVMETGLGSGAEVLA